MLFELLIRRNEKPTESEIDKTTLQTEYNTQLLAVQSSKVEYDYQKKNKIIIITVATVIVGAVAAHFLLKSSPKDAFNLMTTSV